MDKRFSLEDKIDMLSSILKGRVVSAQHADYDDVRTLAHANFDHRPAAVVRVANAVDVAAVINFARATELEIGVRSGGHGTIGRGCAGGLVIDLRELNQIDIDVEARTAWAGTGLTAGEVTAAVERHGLIVGFGDSATVGIGGLTLGGGIGYLVRKHGLTIDSVLAAEIVLANGDILIADDLQHKDLFWAIRGGGGNFGVVTRFKYRLHELPSFTGGPLVLPATPDVLAGFVAAAQAAPEELSTIAMVMPAPPLPFLPPDIHGKTVLVGMMAHAGAPEAAQQALAPFRALARPFADLVRPAPYSSMYMPEDPGMRPVISIRSTFAGGFSRADAAAIIAAVDSSDAPMRMAQVRVLGGAAARVPADATAFAHRDRGILVALLAMYGDPATMSRHDGWAQSGIDALEHKDARVYVNFVGTGEVGRIGAAYPSATLERLKRIKGLYDPRNLFRLNLNISAA